MTSTPARPRAAGRGVLPLDVVRRRWRVVAATLVLVLSVLVPLSLLLPAVYESQVQLRQVPDSASVSLDPGSFRADDDTRRRLATESELVYSDAVVLPVARKLGVTPQVLRQRVRVTLAEDANVFTIAARAPGPDRAQATAALVSERLVQESVTREQDRLQQAAEALTPSLTSALATATGTDVTAAVQQAAEEQVRALTTRQAELLAQSDLQQPAVQVAVGADLPRAPTGLSVPASIVLGTVVGLLLGTAAAFLLNLVDRRLCDPEELSAAFDGVPTLTLPQPRGSQAARDEAVRSIRTILTSRTPAVVLMTTVDEVEGWSDTVLRVALSAARTGVRCVLVDARTSGDGVSRLVGLQGELGLAQLLQRPEMRRASDDTAARLVDDALRPTDQAGLRVLAGGWGDERSPDLVGPTLQQVLRVLVRDAELVLVEAPPVGSSDGVAATRTGDVVVLGAPIGGRGAGPDVVSAGAERLRAFDVRPTLLVGVWTSSRGRRRHRRANPASSLVRVGQPAGTDEPHGLDPAQQPLAHVDLGPGRGRRDRLAVTGAPAAAGGPGVRDDVPTAASDEPAPAAAPAVHEQPEAPSAVPPGVPPVEAVSTSAGAAAGPGSDEHRDAAPAAPEQPAFFEALWTRAADRAAPAADAPAADTPAGAATDEPSHVGWTDHDVTRSGADAVGASGVGAPADGDGEQLSSSTEGADRASAGVTVGWPGPFSPERSWWSGVADQGAHDPDAGR
jgi:capsular polysaccharide biosynthesis protein